jgi:hypothetical protein
MIVAPAAFSFAQLTLDLLFLSFDHDPDRYRTAKLPLKILRQVPKHRLT